MFPLPITTWIMIALSVVALGGVGYGKYESYKFDKYKSDEIINAREKEHQIQDAKDKIEKDKNAQITAINNQLADALVQLRNRTSRANQSADNGKSGTGATLYAEDAEFLIREASRADIIRTALDACYKQYDAVIK
jgi:hypothetical protein